MRFHAPYMEWAKKRPAATFDLAGSNVLSCSLDDLEGARDALLLSGSNDNGYQPLSTPSRAATACSAEQVTTANGAAGANFQAFAARARARRRRADGAAGLRSAARRGAAARRQHRALRPALRGRLRARSRRGRARDDAAHATHHHHALRTTRPARWPTVAALEAIGRIASHGRRARPRRRGLPRRGRAARASRRRSSATVTALHLHQQPDEVVRALEPALRLDDLLTRRRRTHPPRARRDRRVRIDCRRAAGDAGLRATRSRSRREAAALLAINRPLVHEFLRGRPEIEVVLPRNEHRRLPAHQRGSATRARLPSACWPSAARRSFPGGSSKRRPTSGWDSAARARLCARGWSNWDELWMRG